MPRRRRLQFAGAVYHVINRGNYRAPVFEDERTRAAWMSCLDEACTKARWIVHAWCVMPNHFHVCLETPQPNLVDGMQWLQGTFAVRFNRYRREHGHLFQGRYWAGVVAPDRTSSVCHYIHLNPLDAGIVPVAQLADWRWSSLRWIAHSSERKGWFSPTTALAGAGALADTPVGRAAYLDYLIWLNSDNDAQRELQFDRMCKAWAIGTRDFRRELMTEHPQLSRPRTNLHANGTEVDVWTAILSDYVTHVRKTAADIEAEPKGAPWKVAVAAAMKRSTTATNAWLAQQLRMGSPYRLCRMTTHCCKEPHLYAPFVDQIAMCKA